MLRKDLIDLIHHYAGLFVVQVKGQSAMGLNDLSIHAEQACIPILNKVFNLELKNVNQVRKNHPAIDLIDEKKGVAFQVTSTTTLEKVIATLQKFIKYNLHKQYPTLYIYILAEKSPKYNANRIKNITKDKLHFEADIHIIDYKDILERVMFLDSMEAIGQVARFYEELSTSLFSPLQSLQRSSIFNAGKPLSYVDRIKYELENVIGHENIDRIPELPELFNKISILENDLQEKEKELKEYKEASDQGGETMRSILSRAYKKVEEEYNHLKRTIEQVKGAINALSLNIKRQKEFLDQIDHQQASDRMKEAKRLFETGEYAMVNTLLNYEGRKEYINKKLDERERQSTELKSLANEEVLLALNMLRRQDWRLHIQQIRMHFEQSIELAGYDVNALQYSYFLEEIDEKEEAVKIMHKALAHLPGKAMENRAATLCRLGKLLRDTNNEDALKVFMEALPIYEHLFDIDRNSYEFALADTLTECASLYMAKSSLEQARGFLEQAIIIVSTRNEKADTNIQKLTYIILMALGSLHRQLGNNDQMVSYQKLALYMGATISLYNPENELFALLEAVRRFRILLNDEKERVHSEMIYDYALYHYVRIQKWQSQDDAFSTAEALNKLGGFLLVKQEAAGAGVCFHGALKILRTLNKKGYHCLADISDTLKWVGFIHITKNNVTARRKVLLEALQIRKQLAENEPIENLSKAASLLNELYENSFIAVPPSEYYKAYPFFEEALAIHKRLDNDYQSPNFQGWLRLLQHKSIFLSKGLDKTDAIVWYQELIHLINRIPSSSVSLYEEDIQISIHEVGQVLLENININHLLFQEIAENVVKVRKDLYKLDTEKYHAYLLWALLHAGHKLAAAKRWKEACPYLQDAIEIIQELIKKDPDNYHKYFVTPALELAYAYSELQDHAHSAILFTDLCNYFESRVSEHPRHPDILVSLMLSLTQELLANNQREKAVDCIARARLYMPVINDFSQQNRLKTSFEELIQEHFPGNTTVTF